MSAFLYVKISVQIDCLKFILCVMDVGCIKRLVDNANLESEKKHKGI